MGYYHNVHFKQLEVNEIYPFMQEIKRTAIKHLDAFAYHYFSLVPYLEACEEHIYEIPVKFEDLPREKFVKAANWAHQFIFQYKFFYDAELKLFAISGRPVIPSLFDGAVAFESDRQHLDKEKWGGIPAFEAIYDKWMSFSDVDMEKLYNASHPSTNMQKEYPGSTLDKALEKYRKACCYEEIWKRYEGWLCSDNKDENLYISLFDGTYDPHIREFLRLCHERYRYWFYNCR